jgi:ketosteroid isomerase-like protein
MESDNVRLVRRLWDLFNRLPADPDERAKSPELVELLNLFDPEIEFVQRGPQADADRFEGRRAFSDIWADWLGTWSVHRSAIAEIREQGDRLLVMSHEHFVARDDLAVETEGSSIVTVARDRITRLETFAGDRAAAIDAFDRSD